jgi:hypothetical protein
MQKRADMEKHLVDVLGEARLPEAARDVHPGQRGGHALPPGEELPQQGSQRLPVS